MSVLIKVAVVGHTNTGKTSLLRTLTRNIEFGEIANRPSTTRHVEGAALMIDGQAVIGFYDTPGLEDSIGLLEHLEQQTHTDDWVVRLQDFLNGPQAEQTFSQEAKSLRQVIACDVVLYVIDVRERVLGKYRDELTLLRNTARPVIPLLNFVDGPEARTEDWQQHLTRLGLHASLRFNPLVIDAAAERRLFEKMQALNDVLYEPLGRVIDDLHHQRQRLRRIAADLIADLLLDVAAHAIMVSKDDYEALGNTRRQLAGTVRERELRCAYELLRVFGFRPDDYTPADLLIDASADDGTWLSLAGLRELGLRGGGGMAAGASAGLAADVMVGGLSLGLGTATGAAVGALYTLRDQSGRALQRLRGRVDLRIGNDTLYHLAARQLTLAENLLRRGHADPNPVQLDSQRLEVHRQRVEQHPPEVLNRARYKPEWSGLTGKPVANDREQAREKLTALLERLLLTA